MLQIWIKLYTKYGVDNAPMRNTINLLLYFAGGCKGLCQRWELDERTYISRLRSALPLYGSPLCQVGIFTPPEYSSVFGPLQTLADQCQAAADKVSAQTKVNYY